MTPANRAFLLLTVVTVMTYGLLVFFGSRYLIVGEPPMLPFDLRALGYGYIDATAYLDALPDNAARLYIGKLRALDTVFSILMGAWLATAIWRIATRLHPWSRIILFVVPGAYVMMGLAENALLADMVRAGSEALTDAQVALASSYTMSKFVTFGAAVILVLALWARRRWGLASSLRG